MSPDRWQETVLRSSRDRIMLLCSRQAGKTTIAAALALREAMLVPDSLVLLLSPTLRQSGEMFRDKVTRIYNAIGRPVACRQESALTMTLENNSRIISLPGEEGTVRGYSNVRLLVIDEAAIVSDELYRVVRPMLAVSHGQLICLSTPWGKRGWFYDTWSGPEDWERIKIVASDCPRIEQKFLKDERRALGDRWYRQEYECSFEDVIDSCFRQEDIDAAMETDSMPMFVG